MGDIFLYPQGLPSYIESSWAMRRVFWHTNAECSIWNLAPSQEFHHTTGHSIPISLENCTQFKEVFILTCRTYLLPFYILFSFLQNKPIHKPCNTFQLKFVRTGRDHITINSKAGSRLKASSFLRWSSASLTTLPAVHSPNKPLPQIHSIPLKYSATGLQLSWITVMSALQEECSSGLKQEFPCLGLQQLPGFKMLPLTLVLGFCSFHNSRMRSQATYNYRIKGAA